MKTAAIDKPKLHSELAVIGEITKDWAVVRLGDESIADLIMGQSPPSSTYNYKGIGLPFLQGNAEFGETYPAPILSCSQPIKIAEKNDILLSVRAPVGDINIASSKSCIGRGLAAIRPKRDKLDHLFLFYYLKFGSRKFESLSMGSTFKAIRKEEVVKFQIPLPPLPEQRRIAEVLGTVDSAIQKVGGAIESTDRLKKGLMQRLLTRGIGHERFKSSKELGCEIPGEWKYGKIVEFSMTDDNPVQTGPFGAQLHSFDYVDKGIPLILIKNVLDGQIVDKDIPRITETKAKELARYRLKSGDIVFSRVGSVGRTAIVKNYQTGWLISGQMLRIRLENPQIDNDFLSYVILTDWFQKALASKTVGATRKSINTDILSNLPLLVPPLPEQRRIAEILSVVDRKLDLERRRKEKLERVKKGLMNELLTGRKRVKVD